MCPLRFVFGAPQFVQPPRRQAGRDACESFAHQRRIDEHAVIADDVRKPAPVGVERGTLSLEMHPAAENQLGEPIARLARKRCRGVESAADLRGVDPQQPYPAQARDRYGVPVENRGHEE
jgi:hypothetical protein